VYNNQICFSVFTIISPFFHCSKRGDSSIFNVITGGHLGSLKEQFFFMVSMFYEACSKQVYPKETSWRIKSAGVNGVLIKGRFDGLGNRRKKSDE